jgi:hypothetical protein
MIKTKYIKIIFFCAVLLLSKPVLIHADDLNDSYVLLTTSTTGSGSTGSAMISGYVDAIQNGVNPATASLQFFTLKSGQSQYVSHPVFHPLSNGSFSNTISGLDCGANYSFYLYESPHSPPDDVPIQYYQGAGLHPAFSIPIDCSPPPAPPLPDVLAPVSAGAETINGVNWGNVTVTDNSINISGAHLVPLAPFGQKSFKIEWGKGQSGQSNGTYQMLGQTNVITLYPPYTFSLPINNLVPNTHYYFNILEETSLNGSQLETNLFTYGYAATSLLSGATIHYTFPTYTSINVYGQIMGANGVASLNQPIKIVLQSSSYTDIISANEITSGIDLANGAGSFAHIFADLTSSNIVSGGQYYIVIRDSSNNDLTQPVAFTVPTNTTIPGAGGTTTTIPAAPTDGLVACTGATDCDFNALMATVNRVINFLIFYVAFPLVAIVVAWAGVLLLTSGGNTAAKSQAKSMIGKVVIGLIVALLAWAIIKLILVTLGYTGPLLTVFPD